MHVSMQLIGKLVPNVRAAAAYARARCAAEISSLAQYTAHDQTFKWIRLFLVAAASAAAAAACATCT